MSEESQSSRSVKVFFSYAHEDEDLCAKLQQHFSFLRREGKITQWYDGEIKAGQEWRGEIEKYLNSADGILLLISAAFAHSDFCYNIETGRAMERHNAGEAIVVPIILHPCDWRSAPFAKLQALPGSDTAISEWPNIEKALYEVARGVREIVKELIAKRGANNPINSLQVQESALPAVQQSRDDSRSGKIEAAKELSSSVATQTTKPADYKPDDLGLKMLAQFIRPGVHDAFRELPRRLEVEPEKVKTRLEELITHGFLKEHPLGGDLLGFPTHELTGKGETYVRTTPVNLPVFPSAPVPPPHLYSSKHQPDGIDNGILFFIYSQEGPCLLVQIAENIRLNMHEARLRMNRLTTAKYVRPVPDRYMRWENYTLTDKGTEYVLWLKSNI